MKGHPEIAKVRIEVHAEGVAQTETQKRADVVRDFLVGKGVDGGRLVPVGAGAGPSRVDFLIDASAAKPAAPAAGSPAPAPPADLRRPPPPRPRAAPAAAAARRHRPRPACPSSGRPPPAAKPPAATPPPSGVR